MVDEEMEQAVEELVDMPRLNRFIPRYVQLAKDAMMAHLFPFDPSADWDQVPEKYHSRTCEIAVYLVNRRGAEGETSHSESGVSRSYESSGIPASMFAGIVPFAGVPS